MKPYPKYKGSGVPWLIEIPAHWEMHRGKWLFSKAERPTTERDEVITCFRDGVVTLRKNRRLTGFTESLKEIGYQGIRKGDLVIHQMDAFAGAIGVADSDGKGTPVYSVCIPKPNVFSDYYAHLVRTMAKQNYILSLAKGIRERSTDFRFSTFGALTLPVPTLQEQTSISRYLNWKTAQINKFIRNKRRLIALLKEQKQNIINQAVTCGINPNVNLKPSGVEWIGDIPEHWEEARAKYYFQEVDTRSQTGTEEMLSVSHLTGITPRSQKNVTMFLAQSNVGLKICQPDDIVINTMWAWMAALGVSKYYGIVSPSYGVYRQLDSTKYDSTYLDNLLRIDGYRVEYTHRSTGVRSSRLRLYPDKFLSMRIVCPPLDEQKKIVLFIKQATSTFNTTISRAESEIQLILEYRDRLIADVVTGKVDVRGIAVPEVSKEELLPPMEDMEEPDDIPDDDQGENHEDD